jgi:multisubunit Na+/H+ antiporter MnhB subunit
MTQTSTTQNGGFIQIVVAIIVFVLIAIWLGFDPVAIWTQYVAPALEWAWNIFISVTGFLVGLITKLISGIAG